MFNKTISSDKPRKCLFRTQNPQAPPRNRISACTSRSSFASSGLPAILRRDAGHPHAIHDHVLWLLDDVEDAYDYDELALVVAQPKGTWLRKRSNWRPIKLLGRATSPPRRFVTLRNSHRTIGPKITSQSHHRENG
jgi:hypothetical protein